MGGPLLGALLCTIPHLRAFSTTSLVGPENIEEQMDYGSLANLEELHLSYSSWDYSLTAAIGLRLLALRFISAWLNNPEEFRTMLE